MTASRLRATLSALTAAFAVGLAAQSAGAALAHDDVEYCHSDYVTGQNPYCAPLPPKSKAYKGEPIAVEDKVKVTYGRNYDVFVKVLKNDRIEKKSKIKRIEITDNSHQSGFMAAVMPDKTIRLRFRNSNMGGFAIMYRIVDFKGRRSDPTYLGALVGPY